MPWQLDYWKSKEWDDVQRKLDGLAVRGLGINPRRDLFFHSLATLPFGEVQVCIVGQDPYPQRGYATGTAFSIPESYTAEQFPSTLRQIFKEYEEDLRLPYPAGGDLSKWTAQGVLLWNCIPSCTDGKTLSHDWVQYHGLTHEIVGRLSKRGIVFAFLGAVARRFVSSVDEASEVIIAGHPSPRGNSGKHPFRGCRLFSTINDRLTTLGRSPIDWRLPDGIQGWKSGSQVDRPRDAGDGVGQVLDNLTGSSLGPVYDHSGGRRVVVRE